MQRFLKTSLLALVMVVPVVLFVSRPSQPTSSTDKVTYADFVASINANEIKSVEMVNKDNAIRVTPKDGKEYEVAFAPAFGDELTNMLEKAETDNKLAAGGFVTR